MSVNAAPLDQADRQPDRQPGWQPGWQPVRWQARVWAFLRTPLTRRTWADYLYALLSVPLGILGFAYVVSSIAVGASLSITFVGLPLIAAALIAARRLGAMNRALIRNLRGVQIDAPPPRRQAEGVLARLGAMLGDAASWRSMAYMLLRFPLGIMAALVLSFGLVNALLCLTYPIWWSLTGVSQVDSHGIRHHAGLQLGTMYVDTWPKALLLTVIGAVVLLLAPWTTRGVLWLDEMLMRNLLGPTKLARRVVDLTESRAQAVDDSAAKLRRIERDLHDGAQAQLVALAMHLGEAKENLDSADPHTDLAETRALIDTAHRNAKQAISELRDLARGIHPPALDNGLGDALATLASRSALPVDVTVLVDRRPSEAIETIAYFCTAELLTNAAKHSGARRASVWVRHAEGVLQLQVTDDGVGGARVGFEGGLAGLTDRVRTVDGRLAVDSPVGGPTTVTVELPSQA